MGDSPKRPRPPGMDLATGSGGRKAGRCLSSSTSVSAAWLLLVISFLWVSVSLSIKWGKKGSPGRITKRIT